MIDRALGSAGDSGSSIRLPYRHLQILLDQTLYDDEIQIGAVGC